MVEGQSFILTFQNNRSMMNASRIAISISWSNPIRSAEKANLVTLIHPACPAFMHVFRLPINCRYYHSDIPKNHVHSMYSFSSLITFYALRFISASFLSFGPIHPFVPHRTLKTKLVPACTMKWRKGIRPLFSTLFSPLSSLCSLFSTLFSP